MIRGQFTWRDVTFGIGTDIEMVNIKGLGDLPAVDNTTRLNPRSPGAVPGEAYAQNRIVEVELEIVAGDTAAARALLTRTTSYTRGGITEPLTFLVDDREILLNAQLLRRSLELDSEYVFVNNPVLQWSCPDPRLYGAAWSQTMPLPVAGAGVAYPFAYPAAYVTTAGESGARVITNNGGEPTPVVWLLTDEVELPTIEYLFADGTVASTTIDIALGSGETLSCDVLTGEVLLNGTADRSGALSGALLTEMFIPPGPTTVRWHAVSGSTDARLTVSGRDADM